MIYNTLIFLHHQVKLHFLSNLFSVHTELYYLVDILSMSYPNRLLFGNNFNTCKNVIILDCSLSINDQFSVHRMDDLDSHILSIIGKSYIM